jgi:hypothetical protein
MVGRVLRIFLAGILVAAVLIAPTAFAAKPTMEVIDVEDSFVDEELSEECGVLVTVTLQGHVIIREFSGEGGVAQVNNISIGAIATAGDNTFRFRDVGADVAQINSDGTITLLITGQVPFAFAGVLKINPDTEEVILEPRDRSEEQIAKACAALTA